MKIKKIKKYINLNGKRMSGKYARYINAVLAREGYLCSLYNGKLQKFNPHRKYSLWVDGDTDGATFGFSRVNP